MKTSILSIACFVSVALFSCKEKYTISKGSTVLSDTTYISDTAATASARKILVEESTGVRCPNCPQGAEELKKARNSYPDRVIIAGIHTGFLSTPIGDPHKSLYDFRSEIAESLVGSYFSESPNQPAASFDRIKESGAENCFVSSRNKWLDIINQRLTKPSPLNLHIESSYDPSLQEARITIIGVYTSPVDKKQSLSIMITEDKIIDVQDSLNVYIMDYEHNHVLRDIVTHYYGDPLLDNLTIKEAKRVFVKVFNYKIPAAATDPVKGVWNLDNLNIIAVVHNAEPGDKEVQQAEEVKLKP